MGKIIAVVNQKGGVGKTTTSINLSASLGILGKKVLMVDLDPQGNATTGVGIVKSEVKDSVYELLTEKSDVKEVIVKTKFNYMIEKSLYEDYQIDFSDTYRSDDAYSPGGKSGKRPDRAVIVYCNKIREIYGDVPIIRPETVKKLVKNLKK